MYKQTDDDIRKISLRKGAFLLGSSRPLHAIQLFLQTLLSPKVGELSEDNEVKEDGEAGSGEPRCVGQNVARFSGFEQDG